MGAVAPIDFEKGLISSINFRWKQGLKGKLHPSIEIPSGFQGILHPLIEIPNDAPEKRLQNFDLNSCQTPDECHRIFFTESMIKL